MYLCWEEEKKKKKRKEGKKEGRTGRKKEEREGGREEMTLQTHPSPGLLSGPLLTLVRYKSLLSEPSCAL